MSSYYRVQDLIMYTLVTAFIIVVGIAITGSVKEFSVQRMCLERGFTESQYYFKGPSYCSKRVNGTDSVITIYLPNK